MRRRIAIVGLAVLAAVVLAFSREALSPEAVRDFVTEFGVLAPVVFAGIYLVGVFVPFGTTVLTVSAGLAFGPLRGGLLTFGVTIFASLLPFAVARRLGQAWVEARVGGTRVEKWADLINRNAFLVFLYLRLLPTLPYEVQNYIAGISRIRPLQFVLATVLGIGPIIFILAFLGDSLTTPGSPGFWLAVVLYLGALLAPVVGGWTLKKMGKTSLLQRISGGEETDRDNRTPP